MSRIAIYLNSNADGFRLFQHNGADTMQHLNHSNFYVDEKSILGKFISAQGKEAVLKTLEDFKSLNPVERDNPNFQQARDNGYDYSIGYHSTYLIKDPELNEVELSFLYHTHGNNNEYYSIAGMISLVKTKLRPILPFFRALNPASNYSGINNHHRENKEIFDNTVSEKIKKDFYSNNDLMDAFCATFDILMGNHYLIRDKQISEGQEKNNTDEFYGKGSKGVLDYLIFPLLSRKLFWDSQHQGMFIQALALLVVVPLEALRFSLGICLTLVLTIPVLFVQFAKSFLINDEDLTKPEADDCCFCFSYRS